MDRYTEKDALGNRLVLRQKAEQPGEHIHYWYISASQDGLLTIRGEVIDALAEYEDYKEDFMAKKRNCRRTKDENAMTRRSKCEK